MPKLAPSLLASDFGELREQVGRIEKSGVEILHLDIMDGHFVPNITFGPVVVEGIRPDSKLLFNTHLMIEKPENFIEDFAKAGTNIITIHSEACIHLHKTLQGIKEKGIEAGVALNPATPVSHIQHVLELCDYVLIMSVNPGFGGQKFIPFTLEKVRELKKIKIENGFNYSIEIDGGIDLTTAPVAVDAGVDILIAGTAVFKDDMIEKNISDFYSILQKC